VNKKNLQGKTGNDLYYRGKALLTLLFIELEEKTLKDKYQTITY